MPDLAPGDKIVEVPAASVVVPPVIATVIGSLADSVPTTGTVAATPGAQQPNVVMNIVTPGVAILVRFVNGFLAQFLGLITAGMTPAGSKLLQPLDFWHLVLTCAALSLPGAGYGLIKDLVTIFGKLEQKYPLATGSI